MYLFQDIDLMLKEIKRRNLRVSAKKKLFIITDGFLCLLICYYMCVCICELDIYTNLYVLYTYESLCIFIYIFFKNTDGFINISRIHFFHLEKQQQEKQHLMMNMYTFSRHAAFLHPYMRTNFT